MIFKIKKFDWTLFILLLLLLVTGVIAIYSASTTKIGEEYSTEDYYLREIFWIFLSLLIMLAILTIPYSAIEIMIIPFYIASILLLILVLFLPEIKGSHRWISLAFFNLQPSELAKISTMLFLAKALSKPHLSDAQILLRSIPIAILPVGLIMLEPDLGTSLVFWIILGSILLYSELPNYYLVLIISPVLSMICSFNIYIFIVYILILIYLLYRMRLSPIIITFAVVINTFISVMTPVMWNSLKTYQQNRILTFIDPMRDPFGSGYQIIQARIAVGSGGLLGKGFLEGTQKNLNFLPEHHTDFIFSVIGEEFGFLGCLFVLLLFFLFLLRIAKSVSKLKIKETKFIAVGVLSYLAFQVFVNIGMNLGIVPTTGIPLPFISYGGSNLLINMFAVSLVMKFLNERSLF